MENQERKPRLQTWALVALVIVVAVLGAMLFQTNEKLAALAGEKEAPSFTVVDKDTEPNALAPANPQVSQADPFSLFSTPFDPNTWDPFQEMDEMQRHIDAMFNNAFGRFGMTPQTSGLLNGAGFTPRMDLVDRGDRYVVRLDVPGAEESQLNVNLEDQTLTVEAVTKQEVQQKNQDQVLRQERRMGRFTRQIALPGPVDTGSMKTDYKDGVLTVTIDKAK